MPFKTHWNFTIKTNFLDETNYSAWNNCWKEFWLFVYCFTAHQHLSTLLAPKTAEIKQIKHILNNLKLVVCGFNILHYGSVSVRFFENAVLVLFRFRKCEPRFRFGSVLFFVLFCLQLSSSATQCTMNGFLCFNALQRWLNACDTLLMLIHSLNYTLNRTLVTHTTMK